MTIDFRTWVRSTAYRVPAQTEFCGWRRDCPNAPVAEFDRHANTRPRRGVRRWVGFCEDHLAPYNRLRDGYVEAAVAPESPAAKRGYTTW